MTTYRYELEREVLKYPGYGNGQLCWIMLNPSTADEIVDDATIRRVKGFTRRENYGSLIVVNLFAARATRPEELLRMEDPTGPENKMYVNDAIVMSDAVVCAWGAWWKAQPNRPPRLNVEALIKKAGKKPLCLGRTKSGEPKHPLYVRADQPFEVFTNTSG